MRNEHGKSRIDNFNAGMKQYPATKVFKVKNLLKVIQGKNKNSN